jgi:hypothetical protein
MNSTVSIATGYGMDGPRFEYRLGHEILSSPKPPKPALGPQPAFYWTGTGGKAIEVDHSLPSSAEVKNVCSHISAPPIRVHGVDSDNPAFVIPSLCHVDSDNPAFVIPSLCHVDSDKRTFVIPPLCHAHKVNNQSLLDFKLSPCCECCMFPSG